MRVKAVISYDGSHYFGFQKQTSTSQTVTTAIEKALQSLQIHADIVGSGRTDTGVHATGQVIHFDLPPYWNDLTKLTSNLNRKLHDIRFKHIAPVDDHFHARFSAKKRIYRYVFKNTPPSVFEQNYIACYNEFNEEKLLEALHLFEGKHDFEFFRKTGSPTHTTIRKIYRVGYKKYQGYHFIYLEANGFLRSQVRMLIAAAMAYAKNEITLKQLNAQLTCQHKYSTRLAPQEGLYLARVLY